MKNVSLLHCALGVGSVLFFALPGCVQDVDAVESDRVGDAIRDGKGDAGAPATPQPEGPSGSAGKTGRPDDGPAGAGGQAGAAGGPGAAGSPGAAGAPAEPPAPTTPTLVASGLAGTLAVDDATLFIGASGNVPYRVAKAGGVPERLADGAALPPGSVQLLSLDATHAYWSVYTGVVSEAQGLTGYAIARAPKRDGQASLVTSIKGPNFAVPAAIAVDDEWVYLTQPDIYNGNGGPESLRGAVRRVPKGGGPAQDLSNDYSYAVAVDGAHVFWARPAVGGGRTSFGPTKTAPTPRCSRKSSAASARSRRAAIGSTGRCPTPARTCSAAPRPGRRRRRSP